jgi:tripartite-type tricarboxylate transporter receptor subunit TctC
MGFPETTMSLQRLALLFVLTVLGLPVRGAEAAEFPSRPIKLIVPYSAGGSSEVAVRAIAEGMSRDLGQPVLVDNRPGADGAIAVKAGISAEPDGHTLLVIAASMMALPAAIKPAPFDITDFAPISTLGDVAFGLFVPAKLPVSTPGELLTYARAQSVPLTYASVSLAMDAMTTTLARSGNVSMTRVPYKGGGQAMADLIGGHVQVFFGPIGNGLPAAREGRVRLLATHPQRTTLAPEVPTMAEAGIALAPTPVFMMIAAPARTPQAFVDRVARSVAEVLRQPDIRDRLQSLGISPEASSPERAATLVRQAQAAYVPVVRMLDADHEGKR